LDETTFISEEEVVGGLDGGLWADVVVAAPNGLLTICKLEEPMMPSSSWNYLIGVRGIVFKGLGTSGIFS